MSETSFERLRSALANKTARVGVVGLGYVGLPLAASAGRAGFPTIGFDIDAAKAEQLNNGRSYIDAVSDVDLAALVSAGKFTATADFRRLAECDVVVICVPTPLTRHREPDLSYIEESGRQVAKRLRPGQLIVLESTTYPGTTREVLKPILEGSGHVAGRDFFVGFSPEREDPGNASFRTTTIPKVVAGDGAEASELVSAFYGAVVETVVPVSTLDVAEAAKLTENIFRAVNIALVNELKLIYDAMGIDVWEVIDAAKTKPFGFMPFYPGPGLGGHCIPIDPFYLTWKAREFDMSARFIELAGEINTAMPAHVVEVLARALDAKFQKGLSGSKILVLGLAYKPNVADVRESPSFKLLEILERRGAKAAFHDPHMTEIPPTREHAEFNGRPSTPLTAETLGSFDAVLISTDHDAIDYGLVASQAKLVVDARNAMVKRGHSGPNVVKA